MNGWIDVGIEGWRDGRMRDGGIDGGMDGEKEGRKNK